MEFVRVWQQGVISLVFSWEMKTGDGGSEIGTADPGLVPPGIDDPRCARARRSRARRRAQRARLIAFFPRAFYWSEGCGALRGALVQLGRRGKGSEMNLPADTSPPLRGLASASVVIGHAS